MTLKTTIVSGGLALLMSVAAPHGARAQATTPPAPGIGNSQTGNGNGVQTDPNTQGTTDRAGQTPQLPAGAWEQPSGSVAVPGQTPPAAPGGEEHRDPNADRSRDPNGNDRDLTTDRDRGSNRTTDPRTGGRSTQSTQGTGTIGTSGSSGSSGAGTSGAQIAAPNRPSNDSRATGNRGPQATGTAGGQDPNAASTRRRLPNTASPLPLLSLGAMLSFAAAALTRLIGSSLGQRAASMDARRAA